MLKEKYTLFDALNSYHPDIKFKLEQNPKKFLDTKIIKETNKIKTQVFVKKSTYPVHWSSVVPFAEGVARRCSVKKVLLKISQNSQENTCARVSFLINLQA